MKTEITIMNINNHNVVMNYLLNDCDNLNLYLIDNNVDKPSPQLEDLIKIGHIYDSPSITEDIDIISNYNSILCLNDHQKYYYIIINYEKKGQIKHQYGKNVKLKIYANDHSPPHFHLIHDNYEYKFDFDLNQIGNIKQTPHIQKIIHKLKCNGDIKKKLEDEWIKMGHKNE